MQVIRWFQDAYWEQRVVLDNTPYFLVANWNTRDDTWVMSVYNNDDEPLVIGVRLNINIDILANTSSENKPKGGLYVIPIARNVEVITRDNMGSEVELFYIGDDEVL